MARVLIVLAWITTAAACGWGAPPAPSSAPEVAAPEAAPRQGPLEVRTLSFPVDWVVERLAGDGVHRERLLPVGEDPPSWQPPAEAIAALGDVDLIVANGAGYEAWLATATVPTDRLVEAARGLDLLRVEEKTHAHGPQGEHSHGGVDPHTWADPLQLEREAQVIHAALRAALPAQAAALDAALDALRADLRALDQELVAGLTPLQGEPLGANHPAWGYLARRYGLELTAFELDPTEPPHGEALAAVQAWRQAGGRMLWWEARPTLEVVRALPAGVLHVVVDPLEQPGEDGRYDYLAQARASLRRITDAWATLSPPTE